MTREVHPVASIFPLMGEDELAALAEDIKANGLQQPVVLDAEGRVIDGRNRLAACDLAGVKPKTTTVNGEDPMALAVSLNVKRRNLSIGQRAIAAAEAWGLAIDAGEAKPERGQSSKGQTWLIPKPIDHFHALFGVSTGYIKQARALLENAPDLAAEVKAGETMAQVITEYDRRKKEAADRERETARHEATKQRLAVEHADLFEAIERGDLTVADAMTKMAEREAARESEQRIAKQNLEQALIPLNPHPIEPAEFADDLITSLGDAFADFDAATLTNAGAVLAELGKRRGEEDGYGD